tara:strand:- start:2 stop:436 length:435 start_codon:yes stop_codon:yes gene_type:complete
MKFNAATDINGMLLRVRAEKETSEIFSKESTRKGRSFSEILATNMYGQVAEMYLIKHHGFTDDPRKYKDVFNTNLESVEVKVTEFDHYVPFVIERANKAHKERKTWSSPHSDILYVFVGNKETLDYYLSGIYFHNGESFCLQTQ